MLSTWNPWAELEEAQRRLGRVARTGEGTWAPATDIVEDTAGLYLYLDLPDIDEGSLEVTSEGRRLHVKATRRHRSEGRSVRYQGRPKGTFSRVFNVPSSFDLGNVTASYDSGVLSLQVPRAESAQPRKIDVSTGRTPNQELPVQNEPTEEPVAA